MPQIYNEKVDNIEKHIDELYILCMNPQKQIRFKFFTTNNYSLFVQEVWIQEATLR